MNIIFFGSSEYSTIVEKKLYEVFGLSLVVSIPPRVLGRNKILTPSPVEKVAKERNVPILTTEKFTDNIIKLIEKESPDFLVVADFGLILPKQLLDIPKKAPLNVHHSLLPKYRGPSPAPAAILAGEEKSGVTIIKMAEGVDTGDIMAQKEYQLLPNETAQTLRAILNTIGAELVIEVINNFDNIKPIPQDNSQAILTKRYTKEDSYIDLSNPHHVVRNNKQWLERAVRAFYPWPGVWTRLPLGQGGQANEKIVKFLPPSSHHKLNSGPSQFLLQVEGKKPVSVKDFLNGYPDTREWVEKLI